MQFISICVCFKSHSLKLIENQERYQFKVRKTITDVCLFYLSDKTPTLWTNCPEISNMIFLPLRELEIITLVAMSVDFLVVPSLCHCLEHDDGIVKNVVHRQAAAVVMMESNTFVKQ